LLCTVRPGLRAHALADWPGDAPNTVGSTGFAILRAHANTDPHFLFHQILGDSVSHQIRAIEQGSNYPAINESDVKTLVLLVPPFPEQQQIAQILDTLDAAIRQTEAVIAKLRRVKVGLLHDLLTRGLDENGELRDPRQNPEQFEDSAVGRIPKSWQVRTIEGSASPEPGSTVIGPFGSNLKAEDYRDEGWPVVFVRDLSGNGFNWKSNVYVDQVKARQLAAHWVRPGDVVATKMGEPPGISAVYPDYMPPGVVTADVLRVRPASDVQPGWLSQFINSPAVTCQIRAITAGVTRPKITLKDFRSLLVALPGKREQCQIMERVNAIEAKFSGEEATLSILKMLKLGLTEDLLTGRIRVPVADELSL
jgi:type I restriction enzyme S subunit